MIKSFTSKALRALWESGDVKKIPPDCIEKLKKILNLIEQVNNLKDLDAFTRKYRIHSLKKPPYSNYLSMDVTGNYRVIFRFENGDVYDVNFLDTH